MLLRLYRSVLFVICFRDRVEVASSLDLAEYDGVVCVSGDGVLVEVSDTSRSLMSEFFNK